MRIPSGTTDRYVYFVAVDATDKTRKTGLSSFTVYRSRNGAAAAAMTEPTINETDSSNIPGVYELLLNEDTTLAAGNDTEELCLHVEHAGIESITRVVELYRPESTEGFTVRTDASGYVTAAYPDGIPVTYSYSISSGNLYCARSDVEDVYGVDNVAQWADLDNDADGSKITARITRAIAWASAEMNDRLRGGPYELPISTSAAATVVSLAADLAGVWLYESRGVQDFDSTGEPIHQLIWKRNNAEKILGEIRAGKRRLDAVRTGTGTNAPMVGK